MPRDVPLPTGLKPPSRRAQLGELTLPFDMLRYGLSGYHLIGAPRGDGRSIALLPGYGASELSMRPLEAWLRHLGYHVRDWGMGRNQGRVAADVERFAAQAREWVKAAGAPPTRSEQRRVGQEWVRTVRLRRSTLHHKKKTK